MAFVSAGDAAKAAERQTLLAGVETKESEVQALAAGADPAAALRSLVGAMDPSAPEAAAFIGAVNRALADGHDGVTAVFMAQGVAEAARQQMAAAAVPTGSSRLIPALATGENVSATVAEEMARATGGEGTADRTLLLRTLLQPLSEGRDQPAAVFGVSVLARAAGEHTAKASEGVAPPDPKLVAMASGSPLTPTPEATAIETPPVTVGAEAAQQPATP